MFDKKEDYVKYRNNAIKELLRKGYSLKKVGLALGYTTIEIIVFTEQMRATYHNEIGLWTFAEEI